MIKRVSTALMAAVMLFTLCACSTEDTGTQPEQQTVKSLSDKYLSDAAQGFFENRLDICTVDGVDIYAVDYQNKRIVVKPAKTGAVQVLFEYSEGTDLEFFKETFERSNNNFVFFSKKTADGSTSLCAYYLPGLNEITLITAPCSNFVVLDLPDSYEMYSYGFIASGNRLEVINLVDGSISSHYSQSIEQLSKFIDMPESFFGKNISTSLEQVDRARLRVKTTKGEKVIKSFLFNCALGVAKDEGTV